MINHHVDCLRKNYKKQTKIIMNGPVSETTTQTYIDLVNQQQPFDQKLVAGFINLNMFFLIFFYVASSFYKLIFLLFLF